MLSIYQKGYDVLVGDCYGVDSSVQRFYANLGYDNVFVYASNGYARNNIGCWKVKNVSVPSEVKGFDFYKQKDIAMANEADYGLMIWDGQSRGTLNNIINLVCQHKNVLLYFTMTNKLLVIKTITELNKVVSTCNIKTQMMYSQLLREKTINSCI